MRLDAPTCCAGKAATPGVPFGDSAAIENFRRIDTWVDDRRVIPQQTIINLKQKHGVSFVHNTLGVLCPFTGW